MQDEHGVRIGGQYWDAIVWATGAWAYYLCAGDRDFLELAFAATRNSLAYFERTEFDPEFGLFRGGPCFMDGVAGYPDRYTCSDLCASILRWPELNPDARHPTGGGLPMMALSTNCLYYQAYRTAVDMAAELGVDPDPSWSLKAEALAEAVNRWLWNPAAESYAYMIDREGREDRQEGLGISLVLLCGIADAERAAAVVKNVKTTAHGIACVFPQYERYATGPGAYGHHCGTVWPHVNAFWADAAVSAGRHDLAVAELTNLATLAMRDMHFAEIYHPDTGEVYGGLQEDTGAGGIRLWDSRPRQSWCATGYLRMILRVLFGLQLTPAGITMAPRLPPGADRISLSSLAYRDATLSVTAEGSGTRVASVRINGAEQDTTMIPANVRGSTDVSVVME
jgi:hypothetical protein